MKTFFPALLSLAGLLFCLDFTVPPAVTQAAGGVNISFAVDNAGDVEIAVLNSRGRIVRHLAAGVLNGENPPPAPLQPGLSQTVFWDGLDDYGQDTIAGPFQVRVRLGVVPVFARTLSTDVFPAVQLRQLGPGGIRSTDTYMKTSHVFFHSDVVHPTDSTLYEDETLLDMQADDETDVVYLRTTINSASVTTSASYYANLGRYNGLTGQFLGILSGFDLSNVPCQAVRWGDFCLGWDGGHVYYQEGSFNFNYCPGADSGSEIGNVMRFSTANAARAPWTGTGSNFVSYLYNGDQHTRGLCEGPDGAVYVAYYGNTPSYLCPACTLAVPPSGQDAGWNTAMAVAKVVDGVVTDPLKLLIYAAIGGVKVDLKGNIYISARIKPHDTPVPGFIETDSLTGNYWTRFSQANWAEEMYGSILKFGPGGGSMTVFDTDGVLLGAKGIKGDYEGGVGRALDSPFVARPMAEVRATGDFQWLHYGVSHVLGHQTGRGAGCFCNVTRFDVDRFGRIFYPNTFQFEFRAMDNNRNAMFRLRNRDVSGVDLGVGHQIEVTDRCFYVADWFNNQIAVFNLVAENEDSLAVPPEWLAVERPGPYARTVRVNACPNPFTASVRLSLAGVRVERCRIAVYNVRGARVRTFRPGSAESAWDGRDQSGRRVAAGLYTIVISDGERTARTRIILSR